MSGVIFAGGAASHALAADHSHEMVGKLDRAAWHKQMCTDRYAHDVSRVAYIEATLSLSATQRSLFDGWKQTVLDSAKSRESACLARQPQMSAMHAHGILERQAHMQDILQHRLADLTAQKPSLKTLYESLSPEQRQILDRGDRIGKVGHGPHGRHGWYGPRDGSGARRAE